MKNVSFLFVVWSLLAALPVAAQSYDPKAKEILDAVSSRYKAMKAFRADFSYTLEGPEINDSFEGSILVKGDKFYLNMGAQEIYNNGTTVWTYLKEENEVNISDYSPDESDITPTKIYTLYQQGYKYVYVQEKMEGNVVYDIIDLVPEDRNQMIFKVRLMIDKKDRTIRGWKMFEKTGNRYTYTIKKFLANPDVTGNEFVFVKDRYKGVSINDLR